MNQQLTRQESDALSAYLDNALNHRDRQRLETQLQARPELRAALHELRQTQTLLRQAPVLRVPRNFTLTPEMVGLRSRPPRAYPVFQLAFTLASIFFALVIGGEVFFRSPAATPQTDLAMAPAAESLMAEATAEDSLEMDTAQADIPPEERIIGETPIVGGGGATELAPQGTPSPEIIFTMAETPTPTPEATYKNVQETEVVEELAPAMDEALPDVVPTGPEMNRDTTDTAPPPAPSWWVSPWRVPQIIFGAAILISGLGLILLRRRTML